jgi:hypothetical protein
MRATGQLDHHRAVTRRDDPTARTACHRVAGLHLEHQTTLSALRDCDQVKAGGNRGRGRIGSSDRARPGIRNED